MVEFILGVAIGTVGMIAKDKFLGNNIEEKLAAKQRELDDVYMENEISHKRKKEAERQVEDLLVETQKLRRENKDKDDNKENLEDELQNAQKEVKKLRLLNDNLCQKMQDYKITCENYEIEVERLKEKLS